MSAMGKGGRMLINRRDVADVISMYKREFFEAYGQVITAIVEARRSKSSSTSCADEEFLALVHLSTAEIMKLRSDFFNGDDTEDAWLDALLTLIACANYAAGFIEYANIALRASSLVVDGAKIMREMKMQEETTTPPVGHPSLTKAGSFKKEEKHGENEA